MYLKGNITGMKAYTLKLLTNLIIVLSVFFYPIKQYLILIGIAIVLDVVIAVYATIKLDGFESFQSKRLKDTAVKSLIYFLAISLARQIDIAYGMDLMVRVLAGFLAMTEMKSIDEKYYKIYGKSLFKAIIHLMPNMNKERERNDGSKGKAN